MSKHIQKLRVYVAGPYTKPDPCANTHTAIAAGNALLDMGFAPYVPHLNLLWNTVTPRQEADWYDLDNQFLTCCDAVLRLPGESVGADAETELARSLGIPVFSGIGGIALYFIGRELPGVVAPTKALEGNNYD